LGVSGAFWFNELLWDFHRAPIFKLNQVGNLTSAGSPAEDLTGLADFCHADN